LPSLVIALVVGILAAALTAGLLLRGTTVWTSQTTMIIDDPYGIALAGDGGQIAKLAELRIKYANLASTYAIAQPVANRLHVPVGVVLGATHVDVPADSLLMSVVGQWSSAADAQKLSSALAQGISDYVKTENSSNGIPAQDQFAAVAVSPTSPATSSGPSSTRAAIAALGAFLGAAVVVFVLAQLFAVRRLRFPA
jgi:capsular polysaccharide biosynthesis protein